MFTTKDTKVAKESAEGSAVVGQCFRPLDIVRHVPPTVPCAVDNRGGKGTLT